MTQSNQAPAPLIVRLAYNLQQLRQQADVQVVGTGADGVMPLAGAVSPRLFQRDPLREGHMRAMPNDPGRGPAQR